MISFLARHASKIKGVLHGFDRIRFRGTLRWLAAISRYRATTSGGPNFAYDLCARKIAPEDRAGYATPDLAAVPPVVEPQAALARGGRPVEA